MAIARTASRAKRVATIRLSGDREDGEPGEAACFAEEQLSLGSQVGLLGALETLSQDVAQALGWSGTGNPLDAVPDLSISAASSATEFNTLTTEFLASLTNLF